GGPRPAPPRTPGGDRGTGVRPVGPGSGGEPVMGRGGTTNVRRICVVRLGGIGDILLATPAVRALSRHFGTTDIDFIVGRGMKPVGIARMDDRRMDFFIPDAARERIAALLTTEGILPESGPLLVVNPAATRDINRWPPDRFVALLDRMAREMPRVRVILSGGP